MALKLKRFDAAKYIETPEDEAEILSGTFKMNEKRKCQLCGSPAVQAYDDSTRRRYECTECDGVEFITKSVTWLAARPGGSPLAEWPTEWAGAPPLDTSLVETMKNKTDDEATAARPLSMTEEMVEAVARATHPRKWAQIDELRGTAAFYRSKIGQVGYRDGSAEPLQGIADRFADEQLTFARAAIAAIQEQRG